MSKRGRKKKVSGPTIAELSAIEHEPIGLDEAFFEATVTEYASLWEIGRNHPELRNNDVRLLVPLANPNIAVNERERVQARACSLFVT